LNEIQTTPESTKPHNKFSTAAKLVQAAALAAALVPLGSLEAEAAPISMTTCSFGSLDGCTASGSGAGGEGFFSSAFFFWGQDDTRPWDYALTLEWDFDDILGPFEIVVTNLELTQEQFEARLALFPNDVCLPIASSDDPDGADCVVFEFSGDVIPRAPGTNGPDDPGTWQGFWTATINWMTDTNAGYPGPTVRVLHAPGVGNDIFENDITVEGSYCPIFCFGEEILIDPEIAGTADSFSSIAATAQVQAVPEPSTLVLLGGGLVGMWSVSRRRRRRTAA
jgi:hypothetical protein